MPSNKNINSAEIFDKAKPHVHTDISIYIMVLLYGLAKSTRQYPSPFYDD